jgi:hypothetical protein
LPFRARSFTENSFDRGERGAASEIVDYIIDEIEELIAEFAHGNFGLLSEVDQIAFDAPSRGAPFVFFDQRSRVHAVAHVLRI